MHFSHYHVCCLFSQEEMKTLDRELSRAKVTANRVAVVVANEWKDANDKVMPVKQWLEERRFMQVSINCSLIYFKMELIYPGIFVFPRLCIFFFFSRISLDRLNSQYFFLLW